MRFYLSTLVVLMLPLSIASHAQSDTIYPSIDKQKTTGQPVFSPQFSAPSQKLKETKGPIKKYFASNNLYNDYQLKITSPVHQSTIIKGNPLIISTDLKQEDIKDKIVVYIDGKKINSELTKLHFPTHEMDRGVHKITINVEDSYGDVLTSDSVEFYLYQHSILFNKKNQKK